MKNVPFLLIIAILLSISVVVSAQKSSLNVKASFKGTETIQLESDESNNIEIVHSEDGLVVYAHNKPKRLRIESEEYIKYIELLDERKTLKYWQLIEPSKNIILPGKYWKTEGYWLRIISSSGEHVVSLDFEYFE